MTQHAENSTPMQTGQPRQEQQPEPPINKNEQEQEIDQERDHKLDEAIEMTFPASDPISI